MVEALGINLSDLGLVSRIRTSEVGNAFCDNKIDAFFFTVGEESDLIRKVITNCNAKIIPVTGTGITKLIERHSYYAKGYIARNLSGSKPYSIPTFNVISTFLSSANVSEEVIYSVVKAVFENFEDFKASHPALRNLEQSKMISAGMTAPLHDGAARYYREQGWIK